jgi:hypothetical protein
VIILLKYDGFENLPAFFEFKHLFLK